MALTSLYILVSLISLTSGSKILIDANPDVIQSNLTKSMTLRCSLNDTDPVPVSGGVIGKRDTQYTPENVQTLTSIVITRNNGDHVASLITGQQPHAQTDLTNIQVNGSLSLTGEPGEEGYIEVTWNYPQTAQVGEYVCEINAITALGHPVTFKDTVEVIETTPSIGQLIKIVQEMEQARREADLKVNQLSSDISILADNVTSCLSGGGGDNSHVETGVVTCSGSNSWTHNHGRKYTTVSHLFRTKYSSPPVIQLGMTSLDHSKESDTRFSFHLDQVTGAGFTVRCETWANSMIYHLSVSWMSVPSH